MRGNIICSPWSNTSPSLSGSAEARDADPVEAAIHLFDQRGPRPTETPDTLGAPLDPAFAMMPSRQQAAVCAATMSSRQQPSAVPFYDRPKSVEALMAERDGLFSNLCAENTKLDGEEARLAGDFGAAVGCGPAVMREIDALYADADAAHLKARAALDARFAPARAARDAWVGAQLDGHAGDAAKALQLRDAAKAIPAGIVDASVAEGLRKSADALDATRELAEATLALWFDAGLRSLQPRHLSCADQFPPCVFPDSPPTPAGTHARTTPIALSTKALRDEPLRARVLSLVATKKKMLDPLT
jgi:hypothetical protein